jgi:hypothetical protein
MSTSISLRGFFKLSSIYVRLTCAHLELVLSVIFVQRPFQQYIIPTTMDENRKIYALHQARHVTAKRCLGDNSGYPIHEYVHLKQFPSINGL